MADVDLLSEFDDEWRVRLKRDGVRYFRTSDYFAMEGEFRKLADRYGLTNARVLADALFKDLKSILRSYDVHFFCFGCPIATLKEVRREPRPWIVLDSDPYVMVHEELIYRAARMIRERPQPEPIAFLFDENAKGAAFNSIAWAEFKRSVYPSSVAQCMATLAPLDDKKCPSLQAADLIAHTARRAFEKQLASGSINYGDLYDMAEWRDELAYMGIYSAEYLRELVKASWDMAVFGEWRGSLVDDSGKLI
jgi:hypothetical protein